MNIARLTLACILAAGIAISAGAQDFDDIYYDASSAKAKQERKAKKEALKAQQYHFQEEQGYDYAPAGSYKSTAGAGLPMSVDAYNRRGIFATGDSVAVDSSAAAAQDYAYTSRIKRFHNPEVVADTDPIAEYLASPSANVNIIVNNPGYYGYWGSPYSPWGIYGYDPFWGPSWSWSWGPSWAWGPSWNWGWGPSWSWGWGPSWSWGWGPSWSWGWGGGWYPPARPAYGAPGRPGVWTHNPRRPGVSNSGQRPVGNYNRPGSGAGNRRPTADGYRPGSGVYPGYNSGQRPVGTSRPTGNGGSYTRPGRPSTTNGGSYTRPGRTSQSSGSSYRPSTSSGQRSTGGFGGGGSRSGGGGSRGGGSHGGRH